MRVAAALLGSAAGSLAQLLPQLGSLVLLGAADFGRFSLVYLVFAWGLSLQMSIVCEPSARVLGRGGPPVSRLDFLAASAAVALVTALAAAGVAALLWESAATAALAGLTVLVATSRGATRYLDVMTAGWTGALRADLCVVLGFPALLVAGSALVDDPTETVLWAWLLAATGALLVGSTPRLPTPRRLRAWVGGHRREISPLLRESLILDASSIGAPFLLTPLLSLRQFGLYRAISNVAAPVRLVLEPLRPQAHRVAGPGVRRRLLLWVPAAGVLMGACAGVAVLVVARLDVSLGVLSELGPYAGVVAAFVGGSLVSTAFYYLARVHASPRELLTGRLLQSGTALALPLLGALVWGLAGAMGGYVVATAFGAVVWAVLWHPPAAGQPPSTA